MVLDRSEARRILVSDGRVEGVVASVPGGEVTIRARQVALAGGSILSPAVLLRSGVAEAPAGRGEQRTPRRGSPMCVLPASGTFRPRRLLRQGVIVVVLADGGWKYISADFGDAKDVESSMESTVWW